MAPEISVIVPFWNEQPNVIPLVEQVFKAFANEPRPLELLLVDDASTDGTWEQMHTAIREQARVRLGRQPTPSAAILDSQTVKTSQRGAHAASMRTSA